jgi:hypothetical protein
MIIWRGWGILTVVFLFGGLLAAQLIVDAVAGGGTYSANSAVYGGAGVGIGGVVTYLVGQWLENRNSPRRLVDPASGEEVMIESRNDLFWIPMRIWGLIGVIGGVLVAVAGAIGFEV